MTIKLNLGCGSNKKEGYVNIDINPQYKPDFVVPVDKLPYKTNKVDEIFARDIIEHISHQKIELVLLHWYDILKPDGKLIIQTPNMLTLSYYIIQHQTELDKLNMYIKRVFGGQDNNYNFHYNGFTPLTIKALLKKTGFKHIKISEYEDLYTPNYKTNMVVTSSPD